MARGIQDGSLRPDEEQFAQAVASGMALVDAYRKVKPNSKAKPESQHVSASKLASTAKVRLRIEELRAAQQAVVSRTFELSAEAWANQVCRIAMSDPRRLAHQTGFPKGLHELDDDIAAAVVGVEWDSKTGMPKYKLERKTAALEQIAKRLRLYGESVPPPQGETEAIDMADLARKIAVIFWKARNNVTDVVPIKGNGHG